MGFANDLGFSFYAVLSTCHIVSTLEEDCFLYICLFASQFTYNQDKILWALFSFKSG